MAELITELFRGGLNNDKTTVMKKILVFLVFVFSFGRLAAQSRGYWNNHVGLDIGASFLKFDQPQTVLPAGSTAYPGLTGSLFFDFVRVRETPSRDVPVWGMKFKFNFQAVGYKATDGTVYYADAFTFPLLLKVKLASSEGYYTMFLDPATQKFTPSYHDRKRFALYLYAGPQYEYVYGKNSYSAEFSNHALAGSLYGYTSGVVGLEFNFETVLLDFSWQQAMQPVYYAGTPLKNSGLVLRVGIAFPNVYHGWRG